MENDKEATKEVVLEALKDFMPQLVGAIDKRMDKKLKTFEGVIDKSIDAKLKTFEGVIDKSMDAKLKTFEGVIDKSMDAKLKTFEGTVRQIVREELDNHLSTEAFKLVRVK